MNQFLFLILYAFLFITSLLPLRLLYAIANFSYLIGWKIIGYRRSVVIQNITRSFPEAKYKEINLISDKYAKFLLRIIAEWLKSFSESRQSLLKRISFEGAHLLNDKEDQDLFLVLGHFGNWEMLNVIPLLNDRPVYAIYKEQSSSIADALSRKMRSRFGLKLLESKESVRFILSNHQPAVYIFIADQSPSSKNNRTLCFMHQPTLVFQGVEKLARQKNGTVIYTEIKPFPKGKYGISFRPIDDRKPVTIEFFRQLESSINQTPYCWLWSHRRWKHKTSVGVLSL